MRVIIPSAKIVNEDLQKIGKLPPVIYPLNNGIVFDSLYDQYKNEVESIDVVCYEKADKIHRRAYNVEYHKLSHINTTEKY